MGINIGFNPKSILGFLIAISAIAVFSAIILGTIDPETSNKLWNTFFPLLVFGIGI